MKGQPWGAVVENNDYELLRMELVKHANSAEGMKRYFDTLHALPRVKRVLVKPAPFGFTVEPAPGEPRAPIALSRLAGEVSWFAWRIGNRRKRFSVRQAMKIAKLFGVSHLRWANSWNSTVSREVLHIPRELERSSGSVDRLAKTLGPWGCEMDISEFQARRRECVPLSELSDRPPPYLRQEQP